MNMKRMNTKVFSVTEKIKIKNIYCVLCGKYRNFRHPKISYIFEKNISSFDYLQYVWQ